MSAVLPLGLRGGWSTTVQACATVWHDTTAADASVRLTVTLTYQHKGYSPSYLQTIPCGSTRIPHKVSVGPRACRSAGGGNGDCSPTQLDHPDLPGCRRQPSTSETAGKECVCRNSTATCHPPANGHVLLKFAAVALSWASADMQSHPYL